MQEIHFIKFFFTLKFYKIYLPSTTTQSEFLSCSAMRARAWRNASWTYFAVSRYLITHLSIAFFSVIVSCPEFAFEGGMTHLSYISSTIVIIRRRRTGSREMFIAGLIGKAKGEGEIVYRWRIVTTLYMQISLVYIIRFILKIGGGKNKKKKKKVK